MPLVLGGASTGVVSLQNVDRTHAFGEDDQRLLTTLSGSLSVALHNARLVHETRQRNAELALINSVQGSIAGELDPQAIYDLVGDKLQEVFDAQVVSVSIYDESSGLLHFPVRDRARRAAPRRARSPLIGFRKHVMETAEPLMLEEINTGGDRALRQPSRADRGGAQVGALRASGPWRTRHRRRSLQNVDRTHAFGEDDQRLLTTLASSLSVALHNARLVHETRQRVAELATVNTSARPLVAARPCTR